MMSPLEEPDHWQSSSAVTMPTNGHMPTSIPKKLAYRWALALNGQNANNFSNPPPSCPYLLLLWLCCEFLQKCCFMNVLSGCWRDIVPCDVIRLNTDTRFSKTWYVTLSCYDMLCTILRSLKSSDPTTPSCHNIIIITSVRTLTFLTWFSLSTCVAQAQRLAK